MKIGFPGVLAGLGVLAVVFTFANANAQSISGSEAKKLVASGAVLIDVRTPGEFADGHLGKAVNVPVDELSGRLGELGGKDTPVVVYCRSGHRSARAAGILKSAGFVKVNDLGAMSNW